MKSHKFNQNKTISASEIAQFNYCSNSWYLQRCGIKAESPHLDLGTKKHKQLGNVIDKIDCDVKKSKYALLLGLAMTLFGLIVYFLR